MKNSAVVRIMSPTPKHAYVLIPRICEYGTLSGKRDFPDKDFETGRLFSIPVDSIFYMRLEN